MRTAAETQDGGADLHRSAGSSLLHTPTAVAVTSRTNTYCDNHGRRNNRHLDELRDNAGFKAGLSRMDKANIVNITDANLELSMSDLNSRQQRHSNVLKCEQKKTLTDQCASRNGCKFFRYSKRQFVIFSQKIRGALTNHYRGCVCVTADNIGHDARIGDT